MAFILCLWRMYIFVYLYRLYMYYIYIYIIYIYTYILNIDLQDILKPLLITGNKNNQH